MDAILRRLVCCNSGDGNVHYSDEDSNGSDDEGPTASVIRWSRRGDGGNNPEEDFFIQAAENPGSIRVLPSSVKGPPHHRRSDSVACDGRRSGEDGSAGEGRQRQKEGGEFGGEDFGGALGLALDSMRASLRDLFSSPKHRRRKRGSTQDFFAEGGEEDDGITLNLAYQETRRLPDVAGHDKLAWAAGVLRIDLTETGIRTLRGLDAFPNAHTLILDSNGLLSLPMDCSWCPSMETLWMCNNEVENLDGLLCQINDSFPALKSLALMGNPVWPAAKSRVAAAAEAAAAAAGASVSPSAPSPSSSPSAAVREGDEPKEGKGGGETAEVAEGREEAAYRLQVIGRLPGLVTLDCTDVTEEERAQATEGVESQNMVDVTDLLEVEAVTDVEESLPRDTPPGSTRSIPRGVSKMLEDDRERRANLPDRGSLPSSWDREAVVMDVGSGWTRMGLAGQEAPSCVFPTVVGRVDLRSYDRITGQDVRVYVGHRAIEEASKRAAEREIPSGRGPMPSPIMLQHPMSCGTVTDWDDMEELWRFGIEDEMGLDAVEHPVLMADSTAADPSSREKATEVLLETLSTPAVHIALQPVLALYACGPTSGLVVDIGESGTQVAPIFDGFVLERGIRWVDLGGKDVTRQLGAMVNAKAALMGGDDLEPDNPCDVLKLEALKAKVCFVSDDIDKDNARMELSMTKPYTLPDGTRITLARERYRAAEVLFDPETNLREERSLHETVLDSILSCERKTQMVLAQTIILTGGTTELVGLNRRLQKELTRTSRSNGLRLKYTVMVPEDDHNNTVWVGGSMLASTGALDDLWFTRAEYEEYGASYIHSKFAA